MDNNQFINFLKSCINVDIMDIIYFSNSVMNISGVIMGLPIFDSLRNNLYLRRVFGKETTQNGYKGKFHGYAMDKSELKKMAMFY